MNKEIDLLSMGYRKMREEIYGKPMGYGLLLVDLAKMSVRFVFKDKKDKLSTWDSADLSDDSFLQDLKSGETKCYRVLWECNKGDFGFVNTEEVFAVLD